MEATDARLPSMRVDLPPMPKVELVTRPIVDTVIATTTKTSQKHGLDPKVGDVIG